MSWQDNSGFLFPMSDSGTVSKIPVGVYAIGFDQMRGPFLVPTDGLRLPKKIYGSDSDDFTTRVVNAYNALRGHRNLGVLLTGLKGTGKTVDAKLISHKTGLPVILVQSAAPYIPSFLSGISEDVVVFIDEFEKIYSEQEGDEKSIAPLLTLLDGSNVKGKLFIMTANRDKINDNFLSRPGRIRYHRKYESLSVDIMKEVLDDLLKDKSKVDDVLDVMNSLTLVTMDILTAFIGEVNMFPSAPIEELTKDFNIEVARRRWTIVRRELLPDGKSGPQEYIGTWDANILGTHWTSPRVGWNAWLHSLEGTQIRIGRITEHVGNSIIISGHNLCPDTGEWWAFQREMSEFAKANPDKVATVDLDGDWDGNDTENWDQAVVGRLNGYTDIYLPVNKETTKTRTFVYTKVPAKAGRSPYAMYAY